MPTTVQLEKDQPAWLEFQVLDDTGVPLTGVNASQIRVFFKKAGDLSFTQKTPLAVVVDKNNIQPGENFTEIGFGWYALYFNAADLDTAETFTWVVIPDNPGLLDFAQWDQQIDLVSPEGDSAVIQQIDATTQQTATDVTDGFTDTAADVAAVQATVDATDIKVDALQGDVTEIKNSQPASIIATFWE